MSFIHWYDWITPTTPTAALIFGIMISLLIAFGVRLETKSWKTSYITFVSGTTVTLIGVVILTFTGFYS
jgi:hypothetical protein